MNHVEEQKNELEALSEIYYNEIDVKSSEPPISFTIRVRPQASNYDDQAAAEYLSNEDTDSDDESVEAFGDNTGGQNLCPSLTLSFNLPPAYPNVKPRIEVLDFYHLDETELKCLLHNLDRKAEESLGAVMIFILVSDTVEWLSNKSERKFNELEFEKEQKKVALEAEEKRKIEGTPVTIETFKAWRKKFEAELLKNRLEQQKKQSEHQGSGENRRLTGREMFEKDTSLASSDLFTDIEGLMHDIGDVDLDDFNVGDDDVYELSDVASESS